MNKKILICTALLFVIGISNAVMYDETTTYIDASLISQNPDPAGSGDTVELRFMVQNLGGKDANNVQFELVPKYPFAKISGENYVTDVSTIKGYQQGVDAIIIKYRVSVDSNAIQGENQIELKETYSGLTVTKKFNVSVTGTEFAQIIYIDKAKIMPGEETPLTFTITNVGNSLLRNLVFSWNEEDSVILPVYSDDTKYIKKIDVNDSVDLTYTVVANVNADPGLYRLNLNLKYETESGSTQEMNTEAGVFVGGETDFDVTFSESTAGQTSLSVANTGNNPAMSVTVRIPEQNNFMVSGSTSSIIGNLDKGDYTIVSFQITQAGMMSGNRTIPRQQQMNATMPDQNTQNNNLKVLVEYTDTTGVRHSVEKDVAINFRSSTNSTFVVGQGFGQRTQTDLTPYILLALIVVGFVCYKKREKLKQIIGKMKKRR
ncbi:MAG: COG1361 S-layer family protein [Candidatus Aenigmatarchaeota archaeon]